MLREKLEGQLQGRALSASFQRELEGKVCRESLEMKFGETASRASLEGQHEGRALKTIFESDLEGRA